VAFARLPDPCGSSRRAQWGGGRRCVVRLAGSAAEPKSGGASPRRGPRLESMAAPASWRSRSLLHRNGHRIDKEPDRVFRPALTVILPTENGFSRKFPPSGGFFGGRRLSGLIRKSVCANQRIWEESWHCPVCTDSANLVADRLPVRHGPDPISQRINKCLSDPGRSGIVRACLEPSFPARFLPERRSGSPCDACRS
jgi:hypothetical protein